MRIARLAIYGLLAFVLCGCVRNVRSNVSCTSVLRMIDGSTIQVVMDQEESDDYVASWEELQTYATGLKEMAVCPEGGKYILGSLNRPTRCSFHGSLEEIEQEQ